MMSYRIKIIYKTDNRAHLESGYLTGYCAGEYQGLFDGWQRVKKFAEQALLYAIVHVEIEVPYVKT